MIPLRSSERTYSRATMTLIIILANVLIFLFELSLPRGTDYGYYPSSILTLDRFIETYGLVPDRFHFYELITSMFIHGGFLHILGNMWFLWIFGKGIEDLLGHTTFLIFYLSCGIAAGLTQVFTSPFSPAPTVGASGAIAGVMGAYLVKFPRARIVTLVPLFIFLTTFDVPAAFLLIYWFLIQFFSGVGTVGRSALSQGEVAWFAHVGGFLAGIVFIMVMPKRQRYRSWY